MKKLNFNLNYSFNRRIMKDIFNVIDLNGKKILEIISNDKILPYLSKIKSHNSFINQVNIENIYNMKSTYDIIFEFFLLSNSLINQDVSSILNKLYDNLLFDGYLILIEEYDNFKKRLDNNLLTNNNFELVYSNIYNYKYNMNSTRNIIEIFILKKKNNIINKLDTIKSNLCLYYSKINIINNINYYCDLDIDNLKFVFPIKAFPNDKIINLFNQYGFNYDVSHKKEKELVNKYNKMIFYSDPTGLLKNKDSIRLNINGLNSHFGIEYDNKSHEIFHIHLSMNKNKNIRNKIINQLLKLDYSKTMILNIGGGYDKLTYFELYSFLKKIREIVPNKIIIILEAGSLWFKNAGYLITKVECITNIRNNKFIFINASRDLHSKWSIPCYINNHYGKNDYIICGSTCYENDLFAHVYNSDIKVGDRIYFKNIDSYSYSFNSSFNGVEKAEVIIDE